MTIVNSITHSKKFRVCSKTTWIVTAILAVFEPLQASEYSADKPFTWQEAVEIAIANNKELAIAKQEIDAASTSVKVSKASYGPDISLFSRTYSRHLENFPESKLFEYGIQANQNLFNGFLTSTQLEISETLLQRQKNNFTAVSSNVAFQLKSAWVSILYGKKSLVLSKQLIKRRQESFDLVQLRYEGGIENSGSKELSSTYLEIAKLDVSEAESQLALAETTLQQILGMETRPSGSLEDLRPQQKRGDAPDLTAIAANHPLLKIAEDDAATANLAISESRSKFWPSVNVSAERYKTDSHFPAKKDQWNLNVGITIPLFSNGRDSHGIDLAQQKASTAALQSQKTRDSLLLDLTTSFRRLVDAHNRARLGLQLIKASELRSDIAKSKYRSGLTSFDDWYLIENELISNLKNQVELDRNVLLREADWEKAQGKGFAI